MSSTDSSPLIVKALLPVLAAAALFVSVWFVVTRFAPADRWGQILVGAAVFVVGGVVLGRIVKHRPDLKLPMRAGVLAAAVLAAAGLYWTAFRDDVVNEDVAVATTRAAEPSVARDASSAAEERAQETPAATPAPEPAPRPMPTQNIELAVGSFRGVDGHSGRGTATAIELAKGGRVVTFTDFDVDNGPGVKVYLTPDDSYGNDSVYLGNLKGNVGNQQYEIPAGVDLSVYTTVMLWCDPFSVRMAVATLS